MSNDTDLPLTCWQNYLSITVGDWRLSVSKRDYDHESEWEREMA